MSHYADKLIVSLVSENEEARALFCQENEEHGEASLVSNTKENITYDRSGAKVGICAFHTEYVIGDEAAKAIFEKDKKAVITCEYACNDNCEMGGATFEWIAADNENGFAIDMIDSWDAESTFEYYEHTNNMESYWDHDGHWCYDYWNGKITLSFIANETGMSGEEIVDSLMEYTCDHLPGTHENDDQALVELLKNRMVEEKLRSIA